VTTTGITSLRGDRGEFIARVARRSEAVVIPLAALLVGAGGLWGVPAAGGQEPGRVLCTRLAKAGFGTAFSWQNTLSRTAPLLLAALCVALPARLGLVVIGGEGAIVLGGVAAGALGLLLAPGLGAILAMAVAGSVMGAIWIGAVGRAAALPGGERNHRQPA
jgi:general nucleoside transport system permease protein